MMGTDAKVLYIAGYGRSGSTLLERILGQFEGFFPVGELETIWHYGFVDNHLCACGQSFSDCDFWQSVVKEGLQPGHDFDLNEIAAIKKYLRFRRVPQLSMPCLTTTKMRNALSQYARLRSRLLSAIQKVSGAKVIIDSSKSPVVLYALNEVDHIDYHVVHLVRDSRGVAFSWLRKKPALISKNKAHYLSRFNVASSSLIWSEYNLLIEAYGQSKRLLGRVRYEDFIADPKGETLKILSGLGEKQGDLEFLEQSSVEFKTFHSLNGNPMRFQKGKVQLAPDEEWKQKMPKVKKAMVTAMTYPLLARYGYLKQ
ncbi:MAG: sulfotransferase [Nitrospirales bacterium]|nr:sulfotransferase [Nitrospira sp.]MDR4502673.1 sulfotransferase [Nitrospirales bacterium]